MEELHILLTPNKEHKKIFPHVPVVGFRDVRALRITWLEPDYPNLSKVEDVNNVGKKLCLVCDSISTTTTFTAEACQNFRKAP